MRLNNMNIISGILCVLSFLLAISITFTDMFWYLPGFLSCYYQWFQVL